MKSWGIGAPFASKPALTLDRRCLYQRGLMWGAGLLAKGAPRLVYLYSVECRTTHRRTTLREEQTLQLGARAFGAHERFAHQERIHVADFHQFDIGPIEDAALSDHQTIARNSRQQVQGGFEADVEGVQVAVVHADQRRIGR